MVYTVVWCGVYLIESTDDPQMSSFLAQGMLHLLQLEVMTLSCVLHWVHSGCTAGGRRARGHRAGGGFIPHQVDRVGLCWGQGWQLICFYKMFIVLFCFVLFVSFEGKRREKEEEGVKRGGRVA